MEACTSSGAHGMACRVSSKALGNYRLLKLGYPVRVRVWEGMNVLTGGLEG